ncbi:outer membrane beta-barrel family protein [Hymenobacter terrestris]|uniref:TonB-dependent receptor n=1 Tax=Hymenobacter terrestris TaxID=2748310 RepID=A0ABX2Q6N4_9BACT|nr:outer membrane beta-barrel family protein [Hymenobacter terrestris]NVO86631.1 TonB-dependent receptor [Hymenobacter terrestris]
MRHLYTRRFIGLLSLLSGLLFVAPAQAQQAPLATAATTGAGRLTGMVLDSLKAQSVPYATVVLLPADAADDKPITGAATDERGRFVLDKLTPGNYRLRALFVGYATRTRPVTVTAGTTDAGSFRLPVAGTTLGEVVVTGTKPVIEVRPDRLVYNADQDLSNAGGTAADVLRKAPLLAVDGDGNVQMRGSGNFRVLINNKPSPTLAKNLAEALKSIPAEQIQSVELITTPPAKYDGEGTAGIINIVLKKGVQQKANGRLSATTGNRNSGLNSSLNFRTGKLGFTSSLGGGLWYNPGQSLRERTSFDASGQATSLLQQNSDVQNNGGWYYGSVGFDFDPADHHSFSLASSLNGWGGSSDQTLRSRTTPLAGPDTLAGQLFVRDNRNRFSGLNTELTGTYTRTFEQKGREWSVLGQYAGNPSTSGYDFEQYNGRLVPLSPALASARERSRGRQPGSESTIQTDFVQPMGKDDKQKLETGLKAIWRSTGSRVSVDSLAPETGEPNRLPARGTDFDYQQDVQAAYATYSFGLGKKLSLSLGGRLERTALTADFRTTDTGFRRSYYTPLPNGNAQLTLSEASSLRLAYSRRITRPYIYYLNPFRDVSDPNVVSFGNPDLEAELTDSYELAYNTSIKTATLNVSGSVRRTGNAIEQVSQLLDPVRNITEQTFRNVAANTFYELNVYGSLKPVKGWELSGGPNVRYITRRSTALNLRREGFTAGLNLNTSYKLPKEFMVQAFLYGSLPDPQIQGTGSSNLYYSLGGKKTFWKERADLTLNVANPFNQYWAYRSTLRTAFFEEASEYRAYNRAVRLSFGYRFGDAKSGGGSRRKTISNDDVKGGGSQQGGQQ